MERTQAGYVGCHCERTRPPASLSSVVDDYAAMILHRIIRLVCLAGAVTAPMFAASLCRFISRIAVKHVLPRSGSEQLPSLTQTWVTGVADGSFPLLLIALVLSALVAASGLYVLFSKRLSPDAVATVFALVCCVAYTSAVVSVGSTVMALVIPFLPTANE